MKSSKGASKPSGLCPVCAITSEDLSQHLETHSKEEIIQSLSMQNSSHEAHNNNQVTDTSNASPVNQRISTANNLLYSPVSSIQNVTTIYGSPAQSATPYLPYNPSWSLSSPLLSGLKNVNGAGTSSLSSNVPSIRGSYIQTVPTPGASQFPPPPPSSTLPILPVYRHPNSIFQPQNENINAPIVLQNSQYNQNISSYGVDPTIVNHPVPQTELLLPSTSSQLMGPTSMESGNTSIKVNNEAVPLQMNTVQGSNYLPGNITSNAPGQAVFCILPYAQIQPSFPSGGNYILCNNGIIPGNSMMPDMYQQQAGVNYILGTNNHGLPVNNSQFPNQVYYVPPNITPIVKQEGQPFMTNNASPARRPMTNAELMASKPYGTSSFCSTSLSPSHLNNNNNKNNDSTLDCSSKDCQGLNSMTTIEVGNNIRISLPKDAVEKKERLKELINRELVRAILLNDSDDQLDSESRLDSKSSKNVKDSPSRNNENNLATSIKSSSNEHSEIHLCSDDRKSLNNVTVTCHANNTIDYNSINVNSQVLYNKNLLEEPLKLDTDLEPRELNGSTYDYKNDLRNNIGMQTIPQFDIYSKFKSQFKIENDISLPSVSGVKSKNSFNNSFATSLGFMSPEKNLSFLDVFSDMPYEEEQVLGAVEEVFSSESHTQPNSLECKYSDNSPSKESNSFTFDSSLESQLTNSLAEDDYHVSSQQESCTPPKKSFKYAKTYLKVKKTNKAHTYTKIPNSVVNTLETITPLSVVDYSQINMKIQNISVQTDDEAVDDPLYEELEVNSSTVNAPFMNTFSKKIYNPHEDPLSEEDSNEGTSFYQGVPLKIENGESNGTLAEEVMSLKASETLADSESERATPSEELTEIYYGRSCIFAGEPGPPNLSSQGYSLESTSESHEAEQELAPLSLSSSMQLSSLSVNAVREHGENSSDDMISLTLDASCSILPADTIHIPHLLSQDASKAHLLKEETWTKPLQESWLKGQEDSKAFVTTGIVDNYAAAISPHASTSGLQNFDKGMIKKAARDDEEYDFEYESDCYGDSDSDLSHHHNRGPLDLEKWRCMKCHKTFKSLKEKLLHSGHHSPCFTGKALSLEDVKGSVLDPACDSGESKTSKLISPAKDSEHHVISSKNHSMKGRKKIIKKIKVEENLDMTADNKPTDTFSSGTDFKCIECYLTFPTLDLLFDHRKTVLKSRYCCPVCHMEFKTRIEKLQHMKAHPASKLKCSLCHRSFDSLYSWSQHQLFHLGLIFYECKQCGHKCQRKGELDIHYRKHSGEKPYSCETCLSTFVSNTSLKRHLLVHMKGQETECDICHKRYKNAFGLAKHKLKFHSTKKKFPKKRTDFMCETCNEIFHSEKKLVWHREIHERWPKKCQSCGDCFIHQAYLTKHIRLKHDPNYIPSGSDKDSVLCTICKKAYKRSSIPLHMRIHTGMKPFKCNVCNKEFTVKCNYLSHKWTHTGVRDRPFKCKLCEKSFHLKRFLDMHLRSHKKIRPYTCNECGKSFIYKSNYQAHTKLHTDEKQQECGYCGKTFFRKYNLNNHVRIHTGETPFECTICRKEFTQKSNYNVHMKSFHVERHAIHEEV